MSTRWWTFAVWALTAATALYWGLKLFASPLPVPARTPVATSSAVTKGDLTRLLGADVTPVVQAAAPAAPIPDTRFQLVGVVSPRSKQYTSEGLAVIAVDGKPPRAFRVGAVVDGLNVLQSVGARGAQLGPRGGAALVALNLAPPAAAATGTLPPASIGAAQSNFAPAVSNPPDTAAPMNPNGEPPPMAPMPPGYGQPIQAPPAQAPNRRALPAPLAPIQPQQMPMTKSPRLPGQAESIVK